MTRKNMADDILPGDIDDDILPGDATRDTVDAVGADPDGSLFRRLKGWTKASIDHLAEWRSEADESYEFYNGYQWSREELAIFEADGRPAPVFNLVQINIDAIAGLEVNNRQDVKYLPRTAGDAKVNELLSSAAMWVRDQAKSEREESDAFTDAAITGIGVTETRKPEPDMIAIDRRDPRTAFWDRNATKRNLADRRYAGRVVWLDLDEAEDMFPGVPYAELNAKWAAYGIADNDPGIEPKDYSQHQRAGKGIPDNNRPKRICMVEIEWYDFEDGGKIYKQAFLGQTGVLEVNPLEAWAYNFITAKRDEKKKIWYGIVRALKDPQRILNKFLATVIHILASNAKGGLIYERGAFADQRKAEEDWSNPQKNVEVTEGALVNGRIRNREAPQLPQGAVMLIEFTMQNMPPRLTGACGSWRGQGTASRAYYRTSTMILGRHSNSRPMQVGLSTASSAFLAPMALAAIAAWTRIIPRRLWSKRLPRSPRLVRDVIMAIWSWFARAERTSRSPPRQLAQRRSGR